MENRVNDSIELIKAQTDPGRAGSRPKPPKAVARSASLEAARHGSDHQTAKQRLTDKTVAQAITLILEALEPKWGQGGECGV